METNDKRGVLVADEVWIATALLHREHPERRDFTVREIVDRARREKLADELRPGVLLHASQHCVANKAPNPGRYRMLFATGRSTRRLYRLTDAAHPSRKGKITPRRDQIPDRLHELLDWYEKEYVPRGQTESKQLDPILALRGLGKEIWEGEDPDAYVRRLREGWE
jgi:hypothetical protein